MLLKFSLSGIGNVVASTQTYVLFEDESITPKINVNKNATSAVIDLSISPFCKLTFMILRMKKRKKELVCFQ